jgi:hypothetical protein
VFLRLFLLFQQPAASSSRQPAAGSRQIPASVSVVRGAWLWLWCMVRGGVQWGVGVGSGSCGGGLWYKLWVVVGYQQWLVVVVIDYGLETSGQWRSGTPPLLGVGRAENKQPTGAALPTRAGTPSPPPPPAVGGLAARRSRHRIRRRTRGRASRSGLLAAY